MDDLLIRGGDVVDGTNSPAVRLDVAGPWRPDRCDGAQLHGAGPLRDRRARPRGCALGFVDIKTHSDFTLPLYPHAESRVHQGITTELVSPS